MLEVIPTQDKFYSAFSRLHVKIWPTVFVFLPSPTAEPQKEYKEIPEREKGVPQYLMNKFNTKKI